MRRIALGHHDLQHIGDIRYCRALQQAIGDMRFHRIEAGQIDVGLHRPRHVADRHRAARLDLGDEHARRHRLPIKLALVFGVFGLERGDQRRHREEVIAADIERERRVLRAAVEIGEIVGIGHGELETARRGIVVAPFLPRGRHAQIIAGRRDLRDGGRRGSDQPGGDQTNRHQHRLHGIAPHSGIST